MYQCSKQNEFERKKRGHAIDMKDGALKVETHQKKNFQNGARKFHQIVNSSSAISPSCDFTKQLFYRAFFYPRVFIL
jgi:hypothetical protein